MRRLLALLLPLVAAGSTLAAQTFSSGIFATGSTALLVSTFAADSA